jgi:hypothetical protein
MVKIHPDTIAIGKNKGHKTTKIKPKTHRAALKQKKLGKRTKLIRDIIGQVVGLSGYEKKAT